VCVLQGSFETLSLPEVLGLLASARKTGALRLEVGAASGIVHVEDGHCRAVETAERRAPIDRGADLLEALVEVCFDTVRVDGGSFRFGADEPAPWRCPEPVELSDALVEVERLLKQWREVVRLIPSFDCRPRLLDALVVDELVLDRERWSLLVALDGRRTVREVVERVGRPVLDVGHALLELIDAGAVGIVEPEPERAEPEPAPATRVSEREEPVVDAAPAPPVEPVRAPDPVPPPEPVREPEREPEPVPVEQPVIEAPPEPAPAARVAPDVSASEPAPPEAAASQSAGAGPGADRGTFLRMFSGLRE
jgi:hypothetical protein